jgi:Family of unknown function (DUF6510)
MDETQLRLDGTAAAGMLREVFAYDMATARAACASCGAVAELGRQTAYMYHLSPGAVLRRIVCQEVLLVFVHAGGRYRLALRGLTWLEIRDAAHNDLWEDPMTHSVAWDQVTRAEVLRALQEYDRLGPERFFSEHGFAPTTTYELIWEERRYPPKAILGTAYEFAAGQRLASGDFEGGKTGAVKVLGKLGFIIHSRRPAK